MSSGSFTAAAEALRLPKSSVARQLARLENTLGCQLIERTTRTVRLTDEGRTFLPYARRLIDDCVEAESVLSAHKSSASGRLVVTAPGAFGRFFLAPLLPAFCKKYPNVRVALQLGAKKVEIGVGHAEIGIRLGPLVNPDLGSRRLGQIEYCLVAAPSYLRSRPKLKIPFDLAKHDFIELRPPATDNNLDLSRDGRTQTVRCVPILELDDPEAVKIATLAGGGISALPTFLVAENIRQGDLDIVLAGWAPTPAPINVIFDQRAALPLRVRAFIDFLFETIGIGKPWQSPH